MQKISDNFRDKDGLISLSNLEPDLLSPYVWSCKASGVKLYVDPNVLGVAQLLVSRPDLAAQAKIMFRKNDMRMKRVSMFGVPFSKALDMIPQAHVGKILKSIYKTEKSVGLSNLGMCATLVTHIRRPNDHIQIEAWQTSEGTAETFYLHGLIDAHSNDLIHFDGATMTHNEAEKAALFESGKKVKGIDYQKLFRLDGSISQKDAIALGRAFLPLETLLVEYTQHTEDTAIAGDQ